MAFRSPFIVLLVASFGPAAPGPSLAQVFVVGEQTATADLSTEFHPTRVELPTTPLTERGRRDLVRNLEAEQGFAHLTLPLGTSITLMANGNLNPAGDAYKQMLFTKGESAGAGDRVVISTVTVKPDRIVFDLNGGPYAKHRFLRHIQRDNAPVVNDSSPSEATGCRLTLVFEGGVPDVTAPEVKALLDPVLDFGVKTSAEAYANTLPAFVKDSIAHHDVLVGMDRKMVLAAMGAPLAKERELVDGSKDRHYEEWIYGQVPQTVRFVRFVGDRVTEVRIAALGQPIVVRNENEMQGYLDPQDTHDVAMGDVQPGQGDAPAPPPPTILKPGEVAPGSSTHQSRPVNMPSSDSSKPNASPTGAPGSTAGPEITTPRSVQ